MRREKGSVRKAAAGHSDPSLPNMTVKRKSQGVFEAPHEAEAERLRTMHLHWRFRYLRRIWRKLRLGKAWPAMALFVYTILGGWMFLAVEGPVDIAAKNEAYAEWQAQRRAFLDSAAALGSSRSELESLMRDYEETTGFVKSTKPSWGFWRACFYAGTLYTTIGYGNVACASVGGRVATVVYAVLGIPLALILLSDLGEGLFRVVRAATKALSKALTFLNARLWRLRISATRMCGGSVASLPQVATHEVPLPKFSRMVKAQATEDAEAADDDSNFSQSASSIRDPLPEADEIDQQMGEGVEVPISLALTVTMLWMLIISALFLIWERQWTYADSVYFFFISLTTVGLGDLVPEHPAYMLMGFGLIFTGLAFVSMTINVAQERLKEAYAGLLRMVVEEYHRRRLSDDGTQLKAAIGTAQTWNNNLKAMLLVPMVRQSDRHNALADVKAEVQAAGMEVPVVLAGATENSGVPAILSAANAAATATADPHDLRPLKTAVEETLAELNTVASGMCVPHSLFSHKSTQTQVLEGSEEPSEVSSTDGTVVNIQIGGDER